MPTKPLDKLLDRELARATAQETIDIVSPLLVELINYSTNLFRRSLDSAQRKKDEYLSVLSLYWHIIEMADGIEIELSQSAPTPALLLLRSMFEALISMEYILQDSAKYTDRSVAWLTEYYRRRVEMYEQLDPSTERGKKYQQAVAEDAWISGTPSLSPSKIQPYLTFYRDKLDESPFKEMNEEFRKQKRSGGRKVTKWFQLFGGPETLEQLAKASNRLGQYQLFYRQWSGVTHAEDVSPFLQNIAAGEQTLRRLREPGNIPQVGRYTAGMVLTATMLVSAKFRPGEERTLVAWYVRDVKKFISAGNRFDQ